MAIKTFNVKNANDVVPKTEYQNDITRFSLKDNGDSAVVRFLHENMEDIKGYVTHEITLVSKKKGTEYHKKVACLTDNCSLCRAASSGNPSVKPARGELFLNLFNTATGRVEVWTRTHRFFERLDLYFNRLKFNLNPIEIVRNGAKGDNKTTYEFFATDGEGSPLKDFVEEKNIEIPEILGTEVLELTTEEMNHYLETGEINKTTEQIKEEQAPLPRRRTAKTGF